MPSESKHAHHWMIEPPRARTSLGRCACGEEREFVNALHYEREGINLWKAHRDWQWAQYHRDAVRVVTE